jgi:hypothetical protein
MFTQHWHVTKDTLFSLAKFSEIIFLVKLMPRVTTINENDLSSPSKQKNYAKL